MPFEWPNEKETEDTRFYSLVHDVLAAEQERDAEQRSGGQRHAYRCLQLIAPVRNGELPHQAMFRHVQCRDVSAGGLAYLSAEPPISSEIIVALGSVPFLFLKARQVRHEQVEHDGQPMHLVACRFTGRVEDSHSAGAT